MASEARFEPAPLHDQTGFCRDLLVLVHANPGAKGLTIKDQMDHYYEDEINHGRLYPNLDSLADMGLIKKGKQDNRTNTYTLTARGERELKGHIAWILDNAGDLAENGE